MMETDNKRYPIKGYPNYEICDDAYVINKKTNRVLKAVDNNSGYLTVNLYHNGKRSTKAIHRIVAENFVDGFKEGLEVNHLDCNKHNNRRDNLEWTTHSENEKHAHLNNLKRGPNPKPVRVVESGEVFESIHECARAINGDDSHIGDCLHGRFKKYLGLTFEYADASEINAKADGQSRSISFADRSNCRKPVRIVETGVVYPTIRACAKAINGDQPTITGCLKGRHKTHHGYHYEYVE